MSAIDLRKTAANLRMLAQTFDANAGYAPGAIEESAWSDLSYFLDLASTRADAAADALEGAAGLRLPLGAVRKLVAANGRN